MVAKCVNRRCNREFRQLSRGRLYILPPTQRIAFDSSESFGLELLVVRGMLEAIFNHKPGL